MVSVHAMCRSAVIMPLGGGANSVMNGRRTYSDAQVKAQGARFVPIDILCRGLTPLLTFTPNSFLNGIPPKTENLHPKMCCPVLSGKSGGGAKTVTNGRRV